MTVLIPAHDETDSVARCVSSLTPQSYPSELRRIVVIADNCSDTTAAEAQAAGADVMIRNDPAMPGKGRALRWAIDALFALPDPPDGIVIVDADSVADPDLIADLAGELAHGFDAVQADYTVLDDARSGPGDRLRALAILLFNRTRNLGRASAGLPASLLGNGMMLSRRLLTAHPWGAFSPVEDLEFAVQCRLMGIAPRFLAQSGVRGPIPLGYRAAVGQRLRWEGGRFYVLRRYGRPLVARMVGHPDLATLDGLFDLLIPPLSILVLLTGAGILASLVAAVFDLAGPAAVVIWAACVPLAVLHVLVGLKAAGASRKSYLALAALPAFLFWKVRIYLHLVRGFDPNVWQRSVRNEEVG